VERSPEPAPYPYRVRIVDDESRDLPRFWQDGRSYVLGTRGARYAVVISNPTPYRVEAVLSIDGLDAIDGGPADYVRKDGYIVPAYGNATIEGFRTSLDRVATFRFSSVADSYAGRLGQARNVGVIGVAFFPERPRTPVVMAPAPKPAEPMRAAGDGSGAMSPPPSARAQPKSAAAGEASSEFDVRENKRPGLGTEFGEARDSRVEEVEFARANRTTPAQVTTVRYNDRAGLLALGIRVDPVSGTELRTRETAEAFRANRFAAPPP
jgi:hypothetical protein